MQFNLKSKEMGKIKKLNVEKNCQVEFTGTEMFWSHSSLRIF